MRRFNIVAIMAVATLLLPGVANADTGPRSKGTVCKSQVIKAHYSANYRKVANAYGTRKPGRNIRKYGLSNKRKAKCKHLRTSNRTFKRWLAPPVAPVAPGDESSADNEPAYAGGQYAIPSYIVMCESGGDYGASNASGAYGAYQIMPGTAAAYGCDLSSPAGQDQCAARIYASEGAGPWDCG